MRVVTFAGAHACGKTSVILKVIALLEKQGLSAGVMKLDCVSDSDSKLYESMGIPSLKYISGNVCPDHYFADSLPKVFAWGQEQKIDVLITESAGLCGRCAPHIRNVPAVCVIDCLAGITSPAKSGPMLRFADCIIITKSDLVSPAEREVFLHNVRLANNRAKLVFVNGLSGQGSYRLAEFICRGVDIESLEDKFLRFTMPSAVCTFCAGQVAVKEAGIGGRIKRIP